MPDNEHDVDHARLADEAGAVPLPPGSDAAPPASSGPELGPEPAGELVDAPASTSWASSTPTVVFLIDRFVCPNWELTDKERDDLAIAMTPVLDDLFPGGLGSEKWAPYFRLVGVAGAIALDRVHDGKMKPLRKRASSAAGDRAPSVDPDAAPGPFTTAAPGASH